MNALEERDGIRRLADKVTRAAYDLGLRDAYCWVVTTEHERRPNLVRGGLFISGSTMGEPICLHRTGASDDDAEALINALPRVVARAERRARIRIHAETIFEACKALVENRASPGSIEAIRQMVREID